MIPVQATDIIHEGKSSCIGAIEVIDLSQRALIPMPAEKLGQIHINQCKQVGTNRLLDVCSALLKKALRLLTDFID